MVLNFPASPTDGQVYDDYYYDSTNSVWRLKNAVISPANFSNTATGEYDDDYAYKYVSFTSNGTLNVTTAGLCDILLVGGGGGGGCYAGAGGGAGGVLYIENAYLPAGSHSVVVGAGGEALIAAYTNQGISGQNGFPSSLWKYYVPGGGGGGGYEFVYNSSSYGSGHGEHGASGGGATAGPGTAQPPGSGVPGIGHDGGVNYANSYSGGGGGAGAPGGDATVSSNGNGGDGISNSITGSAVTYGGGGGGGVGAVGGAGGGGDGGVDGTDGLGGGGGGVGSPPTGGSTGTTAGGSGIVIVRVITGAASGS